jgi:very-short-patch-repair endonuclease
MKFSRNDPVLKQRRRELRQNQTEAEKAFWAQVRNRQFRGMRFFRQYSIGPYILDFYCPALKIAIELDGGQHTQDERREYDVNRTEYLKTRGIRVVRYWNHDVLRNIDDVVKSLEKEVTPPGLPLT